MSAITSMTTAACEQASTFSKNAFEVSVWMGKNIAQISQSAFEIGTVCCDKAAQIAGYTLQAADAFAQQVIELARAVAEFAHPYFEQAQNFLLENRSYATVGLVGAAVGVTAFITLRNLCCTKQQQNRELHV